MARRFAMQIDSQKEKLYFHNVRAISAYRLKPAICDFQCPEARFAKKRLQFGNPFAKPKTSLDFSPASDNRNRRNRDTWCTQAVTFAQSTKVRRLLSVAPELREHLAKRCVLVHGLETPSPIELDNHGEHFPLSEHGKDKAE